MRIIAGVSLVFLASLVFLSCKEDRTSEKERQEKSGGALVAPERPVLPPPEVIPELVSLFNAGAALMDRAQMEEAIPVYEKALRLAPGWYATWLNHGLALMNTGLVKRYPPAEKDFRTALRLSPGDLHASYSLGLLLVQVGRQEEAEPLFRQVLEKDPDDPGAHFNLAKVLSARGAFEEAAEHLRRAVEAEPHAASALYALARVLTRLGRAEERRRALEAYKRLSATETGSSFGMVYNEMGRYAGVLRVVDLPAMPRPTPASVTLRYEAARGTKTRGEVADERFAPIPIPAGKQPGEILRGTLARVFGPGAALADVDGDGDLDLYLADGISPGRLLLNDKGRLTPATGAWKLPGRGRSISGSFGDMDNDGDPDLYVACAGPNLLLRNEGDRFVDVTATAGVAGGDVFTSQAVWADLDADADLDLYLANLIPLDGPAAAEDREWPGDLAGAPNVLFNNNRDGTFRDITEETGTGGGPRMSTGVVASDLDLDADADLLVLHLGASLQVLRNDRIWRFQDRTRAAGLDGVTDVAGAISADLDQDGRPELLLIGCDASTPRLFSNQGRLRFSEQQLPSGTPAARTACALDADLDGHLDLLLAGGGTDAVLLRGADRSLAFEVQALAVEPGGSEVRALLAADLDRDGRLDLIASRAGGRERIFFDRSENPNHRLVLDLTGKVSSGYTRANTGGVGARVEVVTGIAHQFRERITSAGVLGGPSPWLHFGVGSHTEADYVRIVWPDDVVQSEPKLPADQPRRTIAQVARKSSSCPLLFTWDGERFRFVTDFLGTGGLGFFLEPGVFAPPDPTEAVRIPVLEPRNGALELRIHEPMEEVLYLDQVRLLAVDHPRGTIVHPDERMAVNGPAPDGRLLVVDAAALIEPRALATREGPADVRRVLEADRIYQPGVHKDPRFIGYAEPQEIVLDFGPALRNRSRGPLHLFLEGWVEYPYSHVNFAAWQAGLSFEPLSLDYETPDGEWRTLAEAFGYPAGLPRVMTLDISGLPLDTSGRLRLRTNIELYVDRVYLAEDLGPKRIVTREIDPEEATLRPSGYPREYSPDGRAPLLYDYQLMDPAIEYKNMAGEYTRFGDVRELLERPDDMYVIMGRGEEIVLRFPVPPPPPEGFERTWILKTDGYCKDMDLHTAHPHTVEPLPFHGMSAYPYPPSESYPDTPEHRRYREVYNTRRILGRGPERGR